MRSMSFALMLLSLFMVPGCGDGEEGADAGQVMKFTAIPDQDETRLREKYGPVADYLAEKLDIRVEYVHAPKYADSVELFKNGDVHLAWFGGLTGVQARHAVAGARAIAQGEEDPKFYSYFIANESTGLTRSDDFPSGAKGKSFTFGSPQSTSGRLMPEHYIRQLGGAAPDDYFSKVGFSGSHDKTCELVQAGTYEVGVVNYKVYDRMVSEGKIDPETCRIIWQTPRYADYNFTAHPDLETMFGKGFLDRLQQALVEMSDPDLLSAFPRKSLIKASNSDFEGIRELAAQLGFLR